MARIGGPDVVGTLAFGMAFVAVFQFITDLGISTAQQKLVTSAHNIADYIATFAVLKISTSFLFMAVIVAYYHVQVHWLHNAGIAKPGLRTVIFIFIAINFLDSVSYIFRTNFIARTERAKVDIPTFVQTTMDKIARVVLVAMGFGAIALAASSLVFSLLVLPVNFLLFRNYPIGRFRKDLVKQYVSISLPVIAITFAQQWLDNIDRIMLREMHGTYELGLYMAAFSLSVPIRLLGTSMSSILFPSFSTLLFKGKGGEIAGMITRYRRYLIAILLPFVLLMIMFSRQVVLLLFGNRYQATVSYFPLIILTLFVYIFSLPSLNLAFAHGAFRKIAWINVAFLAFQTGMIYLLASARLLNLKGLGAALALLITNLLLFLAYNRLATQVIRVKNNASLMKLAGFQVVLAAGAWMVLRSGCHAFIFLVPFLFLAMIFVTEWKMKVLTRDDRRFFFGFLNFRPMMQYIMSEIHER